MLENVQGINKKKKISAKLLWNNKVNSKLAEWI